MSDIDQRPATTTYPPSATPPTATPASANPAATQPSATSAPAPGYAPAAGFQQPVAAPVMAPNGPSRADLEQLSRIEDKAARIEEKYARSEALLLRLEQVVQTAAMQMGGHAKREDVVALRRAIRGRPGYFGLLVVAVLTAVGTAAMTYYLVKHGVPGLPPMPGGPQPS